MPFTALELQRAGKLSLDNFMRNKPIDQISVERPFLRALMKKRKPFPGGRQFIVENLRYRYQTNLQWYYGDQQVTFNKRSTVTQSQFRWSSVHDGYSLNEDELFQNGITIHDGAPQKNSDTELFKLADILDENNEALRLGFEERFDQDLHSDGTHNAEAIAGLDDIVDLAPTTGTVGGIDRAVDTWWQNSFATGMVTTAGSNYIIDRMETMWRRCVRNGGRPNFIMAGSTFVDTFRTAAKNEISRYTILSTNGDVTQLDPAIGKGPGVDAGGDPCLTGLHFKGVPILWNPVFEELDTRFAPGTPWEKRCYFLNLRQMRLRPAQGHDMVTRTPPRVYDRYTYYWGLTWKGALTLSKARSHAAMAVA